jgi:hypothetical protein
MLKVTGDMVVAQKNELLCAELRIPATEGIFDATGNQHFEALPDIPDTAQSHFDSR